MTIDETIMFCDEKAKNIKLKTTPQTFIDIAEWLEELKALKSLENSRFMIIGKTKEEFTEEIRNKAIDDFTEALKQDVMAKTFGLRICDVDRIAEQLKEGSADNE